MYPDLGEAGIRTEVQARQHYKKFGKKEGRICSRVTREHNVVALHTQIEKEQAAFVKKATTEHKINILIRTSNRPIYFKQCIQSILEQTHKNVNVIVCYDDVKSLEYLKGYPSITHFPIEEKACREKYKFNLYCNTLLEKVSDGWIMFLDDDDMFCHNDALAMINENIHNEDETYLWKEWKPDKLVFPKDTSNVHFGEIGSCGYMFHSNHKSKSKWVAKRGGDFDFYHGLSKHTKGVFLDLVLTRTISTSKIGNFGA